MSRVSFSQVFFTVFLLFFPGIKTFIQIISGVQKEKRIGHKFQLSWIYRRVCAYYYYYLAAFLALSCSWIAALAKYKVSSAFLLFQRFLWNSNYFFVVTYIIVNVFVLYWIRFNLFDIYSKTKSWPTHVNLLLLLLWNKQTQHKDMS